MGVFFLDGRGGGFCRGGFFVIDRTLQDVLAALAKILGKGTKKYKQFEQMAAFIHRCSSKVVKLGSAVPVSGTVLERKRAVEGGSLPSPTNREVQEGRVFHDRWRSLQKVNSGEICSLKSLIRLKKSSQVRPFESLVTERQAERRGDKPPGLHIYFVCTKGLPEGKDRNASGGWE